MIKKYIIIEKEKGVVKKIHPFFLDLPKKKKAKRRTKWFDDEKLRKMEK